MKTVHRIATFWLIAALTACGGSGGGRASDGGPNAADKVIASVDLSSGNNQSGTVGLELNLPLVATVRNAAGQPIAGQIINFVVATGGGSVFAGTAASDSNGLVSERWTLGTAAGAQKLELRGADSTGKPVTYASFVATAVASNTLSITTVLGDAQTAPALSTLAVAPKIVARDKYGNVTPGVAVAFTANNGGVATPPSAVTDAAGEASAIWTLGPATGAQTLTVAIAGVAPAAFTATATSTSPRVVKISGDFQSIPQYSFLQQPLQIFVTDLLGNPYMDVPANTTFSSTTASGYTSLFTVALANYLSRRDGMAIADPGILYFSDLGPQQVTVSTPLGSTTFTVTVTARGSLHPYDGLYTGTLSFKITNGLVSYVGQNSQFVSGTLNETDGTIRVTVSPGIVSTVYAGRLTMDASQQVTGSGTFTTSPPGGTGVWTVIRR